MKSESKHPVYVLASLNYFHLWCPLTSIPRSKSGLMQSRKVKSIKISSLGAHVLAYSVFAGEVIKLLLGNLISQRDCVRCFYREFSLLRHDDAPPLDHIENIQHTSAFHSTSWKPEIAIGCFLNTTLRPDIVIVGHFWSAVVLSDEQNQIHIPKQNDTNLFPLL